MVMGGREWDWEAVTAAERRGVVLEGWRREVEASVSMRKEWERWVVRGCVVVVDIVEI